MICAVRDLLLCRAVPLSTEKVKGKFRTRNRTKFMCFSTLIGMHL